MKLISVNVGLPREVTWKEKTVSTGIFKKSVSDRVMVRSLNLEGDGQADLTVHAGLDFIGNSREKIERITILPHSFLTRLASC